MPIGNQMGVERKKAILSPVYLLIFHGLNLSKGKAVQQFKIGRKRKANSTLNPKRSKIFGIKSNCGTAFEFFQKIKK